MPTKTPDSRLGRIVRRNVERVLHSRGMSPAEFYTRADIGRSRYSATFKAHDGPRLGTIERLAGALGVQMFELLLPEVFEFDELTDTAMNGGGRKIDE